MLPNPRSASDPRSRTGSASRSRWAAIGAAVAVTLGAGGLVGVGAASSASSFVAIEPTRVLDTRIDAGLDGPFTSGSPRSLDVTGTIEVVWPGDEVGSGAPVPDGATSIVANVTVTEPDTGGFVTLRPGSATGGPTTSSVNFVAGQTVANSATVELPQSGLVQLFYQGQSAGSTAEIIVDVVGYHVEGASGPKGDAGEDGADGLSPWDEIPSGVSVTGGFLFDTHASGEANAVDRVMFDLPALAPQPLESGDVSFASAAFGDTNTECTGSYQIPTAPAGHVCIYVDQLVARPGIDESSSTASGFGNVLRNVVVVSIHEDETASAGDQMRLTGTWAYTAP